MNLGILIFLGVNFRFAILNLTQYGYLMKFSLENIFHPNAVAFWAIINVQIVLFFGNYFVEKNIAPQNLQRPEVIYLSHLVIIVLQIVWPLFAVAWINLHEGLSVIVLITTSIYGLKALSFIHVMSNTRYSFTTKKWAGLTKEIVGEIQKYPKCLTFYRFVYFFVSPTLCFQFNYVKT